MNPERQARPEERDAVTPLWPAEAGAAAYGSDADPERATGPWDDAPDGPGMPTQPLPPAPTQRQPPGAPGPHPWSTGPQQQPGLHPPSVPHQTAPGDPGATTAPSGPAGTDPYWEQPTSGQPSSGQPASGGIYADLPDPLFPDDRASWQPRIVPSPPPQRGRIVLGLLVGLLAGLVVFGLTGFFLGRWSAGGSAEPVRTPAPVGTSALAPYERSQLALNEPKFGGALATFAEPWFPYADGCRKNGEPEGPRLNSGEAARVRCEYRSMSLYFVEYASTAERDKIRIRNLGQNVDAQQLTPGAEPPAASRRTPSGRTEGGYVEYAYRSGEGEQARTVAGLWWDDADSAVGAYLLGYWAEGVGESWEPMRDVWARHA